MSKKGSLITLVASLILIVVYFTPIWHISLEAPQYPEGMGLRIWINEVDGEKEHDLHNINKLNHYVGMKEIVPEAIPELSYMPFIVAVLIVLGVATSLLKSRKLLGAWLFLTVVLLIIGLYDFYMWGYDYGHNLDPTAPIRVPGMAYQPPLIGSKKLLNITAVSLPGLGSIIIFLSVVMNAAVLKFGKGKNLEN